MNEQSVAQLALFLRNLGLALHLSGAPAQAVERVLSAVGQRFGVKVEGFAVLTFLALTVVAPSGVRRSPTPTMPMHTMVLV